MGLYLQGQLQVVFDALYELGVIDPVLQTDWSRAISELPRHRKDYEKALEIINTTQETVNDLIHHLKDLSPRSLSLCRNGCGKRVCGLSLSNNSTTLNLKSLNTRKEI